MLPPVVVEVEVGTDVAAGVGRILILAPIDFLILNAAQEPFHKRFVEGPTAPCQVFLGYLI